MKISDTIESQYIKSAELAGREVTCTISHVELETIGIAPDQDQKPVMYFKDQKKGLVLNKTNRFVLSDAFGDETEAWEGKKVILYTENTLFQGRPVKGLRVRPLTSRPVERRASPPDQPPWEPNPSIITEGEAVARQGLTKLREWRDRLSTSEHEELKPEMERLIGIARKVLDERIK